MLQEPWNEMSPQNLNSFPLGPYQCCWVTWRLLRGTTMHFPIMAVLMDRCTSSVCGFPSLHTYCLDNSQCDEWGHISWSFFICIPLIVVLNIFSCICWPFVYLPLKNVCLGLLPIFNWIASFLLWAVWVPSVFWMLITHHIPSL